MTVHSNITSINDLPYYSLRSFEDVRQSYFITHGNWIILPCKELEYRYFKVLTPIKDNRNFYAERHVGLSTNPKSVFHLSKRKICILRENIDQVEKELIEEMNENKEETPHWIESVEIILDILADFQPKL